MPHSDRDLLHFAKPAGYNILGSSQKPTGLGCWSTHRTNKASNTGLACLKFRFVSSPLAANKQKPPIIRIGVLSAAQLVTVNAQREEEELPPVFAEVLFDGRHLYNSRCVEDGYSIDEVLEMISIAFSDASDVAPGWATVLISSATRVNKDGRTIRDEAVFECHGKKPHPELLSVAFREQRNRKLA
jgi:hypothetical protein